MKLAELLKIFPTAKITDGFDPSAHEVTSICFDSRRLERDCVFVAIRGEKADGHKYLPDAAAAHACALVFEDETLIPDDFSGVLVKVSQTRDALNRLASQFFSNPSNQLFCVGVTGTNGKTTVTHMVEAIFNRAGQPTGVIGTIDHHLATAKGFKVWKTEMTTPDPVAFQRRLREFLDLQAKVVAMEVSSHALHQSRVDEVAFDVALFTNLSRDHLDYHRDMDDYFEAKAKLFTELLARSTKPHPTAVINTDDEHGKKLIAQARSKGVRVWSYGAEASADRASVQAPDLAFKTTEQNFAGTRFILKTSLGAEEFHISMPGLHNVYNATAAIGAGLCGGVSLKDCAAALKDFSGVPGRLEPVLNGKGVHIFVDYAHTDGAIETVLHYLGGIRSSSGAKNRIITVFGCGGDRDKGKRPLMMKAAARGSDLVVLTSDNPRTENPESILRDALAGADPAAIGKTVFTEVDRKKAIRKAIDLAQAGDVVLIAGKGHEDYQQIGMTKFPFSDVAVVKEILR